VHFYDHAVVTLIFMHIYTETPPLLLPEFSVRSQRCREWPTSCMLASGIFGLSQVSVMMRTQQSRTEQFLASCSFRLSVLCVIDLGLLRYRLGRGGLYWWFFSLSRRPDLWPRFCFLSLLRLRRFPDPTTIHGASNGLTTLIWDVVVVIKVHWN